MTQNQIAYWTLQETKRSNQVKEAETQRTNKVNESIRQQTVDETNRTNLVNEQIKQFTASEQAKRWERQNAVDIANATTGGIKSVSSAISSIAGLFM